MKAAARLQGAIEILRSVLLDNILPEKALSDWGRSHKFAGSSDRRAIADTFYDVLRYRGTLSHYMQSDDPRLLVAGWIFFIKRQPLSAMIALFDGDRHSPAPLTEAEIKLFKEDAPLPTSFEGKYNMGAVLEPLFRETYGDDTDKVLHSFDGRASFDMRVNTLKITRDEAITRMRDDFPDVYLRKTPLSPVGIRSDDHFSIRQYELYEKGFIEIQDESSQLLTLMCDIRPDMRILDFCAGGGGKALAFAAATGEKADIVASDISEVRLKQIKERTDRAKIQNIRRIAKHRLSPDKGLFDIVIVDAPCSGSGTWRRNIVERMRTTPEDIAVLNHTQKEILTEAANFVTQEGQLIYSTCSLFKRENDDVIAEFLKIHPEFKLIPAETMAQKAGLSVGEYHVTELGLQLRPDITHTDGFYVSILVKSFG